MYQKPLANYTHQQTSFNQLVASDAEPNILLFQGESGSGKSRFIEHCLQTTETPSVLLKLQSGTASVTDLFTLLGNQRGWTMLPHLTQTIATLVEQPQ